MSVLYHKSAPATPLPELLRRPSPFCCLRMSFSRFRLRAARRTPHRRGTSTHLLLLHSHLIFIILIVSISYRMNSKVVGNLSRLMYRYFSFRCDFRRDDVFIIEMCQEWGSICECWGNVLCVQRFCQSTAWFHKQIGFLLAYVGIQIQFFWIFILK